MLLVAPLCQAAGLTSSGGRAACRPAELSLPVPRAPSPARGWQDGVLTRTQPATVQPSLFSACSWQWRWHLGAGPWCCESKLSSLCCRAPQCTLPPAAGCPSSHSSSASSCSSRAAARHGSSTPRAFASPTKVRVDFLGVCTLLGRAGRASCRQGVKGAGRAQGRQAVAPRLWLQLLHTLGPRDVSWMQLQPQPLRMLHRRCWHRRRGLSRERLALVQSDTRTSRDVSFCSDSLWASYCVSWAGADLGSPRGMSPVFTLTVQWGH